LPRAGDSTLGPGETETLAERYERLARETPPRGRDASLRALDIALALFFLLVLAPLLAAIALAIVATDGLPVLYRGERVGRGGRVFTMVKFRTLRRGPRNASARTWAQSSSAGRVPSTRRSAGGSAPGAAQLDELPQLWNVLREDMSLVGPRPIRPIFFEELAGELPAYWQRLVVRPGLTGFAQMRREYETSMSEKLAHDLEWIADRSVQLYLRTLAATAWRVLRQSARNLVRPSD
jgi:lipopolysaccharide/colanic/teichoic acid biosynthesis glycosyltransferase